MAVILDVQNVTKTYKRKGGAILKAVDDVSFSVLSGEIVGFLGPNGAGKSTTIKIIAGLAAQNSGKVFICGRDTQTDRMRAMEYVGGVIEVPEMYGEWSGLKNLCYLASLSSMDSLAGGNSTEKPKDIIRRRALEVLDIVGLTERKDDLVKKYSLGMKQRLGIAQALMNRPKLLILDEPTNGLDPAGTKEIRDLLKKLAHEFDTAILVSAHQLAEMQLTCDRFMIIKNGKIVAERSIDELGVPTAGETSTISLTTDNPDGVKAMLAQVFGIEATVHGNTVDFVATVPMSDVTRAVVMNGFNILALQTKESSLEDVFIHATQNNETSVSEEEDK